MLKIDSFKASDDCVVLKPFDQYQKGDIIPAHSLERSEAVKRWTKGFIKNVGVKKYTRMELEQYGYAELKEIGAEYDITDRSKKKLVEEILAVQ